MLLVQQLGFVSDRRSAASSSAGLTTEGQGPAVAKRLDMLHLEATSKQMRPFSVGCIERICPAVPQ